MNELTYLLTANWFNSHSALTPAYMMLIAVLCGAIIGTEREKREKPAGMRTLILVCMGAAGFTMAGFAFTGNNGDSGRVAAQIVTGIGFLGAGVIVHGRGRISGTTTAASIWVTASIGMIAGGGYAGAAVGMTLLVRLVLLYATRHEKQIYQSLPEVQVSLDFDPSAGRTRVKMERILVDYAESAFTFTKWSAVEEGLERLTIAVRLPKASHPGIAGRHGEHRGSETRPPGAAARLNSTESPQHKSQPALLAPTAPPAPAARKD